MYSNEYITINSYYCKNLAWDWGCKDPVREYVVNLIERELFLEDAWLAPPMFYPDAPENVELPEQLIL